MRSPLLRTVSVPVPRDLDARDPQAKARSRRRSKRSPAPDDHALARPKPEDPYRGAPMSTASNPALPHEADKTSGTTPFSSGSTMRAVVQDRYGSADVLHLARIPRPSAAPHEVLLQ